MLQSVTKGNAALTQKLTLQTFVYLQKGSVEQQTYIMRISTLGLRMMKYVSSFYFQARERQ